MYSVSASPFHSSLMQDTEIVAAVSVKASASSLSVTGGVVETAVLVLVVVDLGTDSTGIADVICVVAGTAMSCPCTF